MNGFQFDGGKSAVAIAVSGHLQAIFKKGNAPADKITASSGAVLNFKCPYHANVIKIFDSNKRPIVSAGVIRLQCQPACGSGGC